MHIPDGYLSPSTCAVLYGAAAPFWYVSLRRIKRMLGTRFVPLLSVFSAFSFVIMMFNLPLPGGTTGHAVGVGIATIVLGPWGSILAISITLLIQALFFGDGGITALGANCFNMAIVGSLVAYAVYRLGAGKSAINSSRRVIAAAAAGYLAINASALFAAVEFGIQPKLFTDSTGAPLYAPYPLSVAIPAMMIGHLAFAGLAELIITAGVVAYLQHSEPSLLLGTAPRAAVTKDGAGMPVKSGWKATRPLWIGLAALMIATPLGLLAAGAAWGEWTPKSFSDPAVREQIKAASGGHQPVAAAPKGLERLSTIWTAPIPQYAPPFMRSAAFGYIMSATMGAGLIIVVILFLGWIAKRRPGSRHQDDDTPKPAFCQTEYGDPVK